MRIFEVEPEGYTPRHAHDWEHEILVHSGSGQVLVARNLVRQIIVEEYPPKRQEALRRRLLPETSRGDKPFTMSA